MMIIIRCGNTSIENLLQLYIGHGDILPVPNIIIKNLLPFKDGIPFMSLDDASGKAFISSDDKVFIVESHFIKLIKNIDVLNLYNNYHDNDHRIYTNTSSICFFTMDYLIAIVPDLYQDNKAYRLSNDRYVYLVLNYTRHAFKSGKTFIQMFGDWDQVIVIDHTKYSHEFFIMPTGTDME